MNSETKTNLPAIFRVVHHLVVTILMRNMEIDLVGRMEQIYMSLCGRSTMRLSLGLHSGNAGSPRLST
ncbi:MAG TPA: hypothetical protein PKL65_14795, partial [Bacteroidales bacterium]|nr:hypothetical protein [Bacteroidales bacterium]